MLVPSMCEYSHTHMHTHFTRLFSLDALDPNAYKAFQVSQDLKDVVERVMSQGDGGATGGVPSLKKSLSVRLSVMTAVKPMLVRYHEDTFMFRFQKCFTYRLRHVALLLWQ